MTRRRSFSKKERARIFVARNGQCHLCGGQIQIGQAWEIEHVVPWELSRDDSDENLRPAHRKCHKEKTHKHDRPMISKAKNLEAKHKGFFQTQRSIQGRGFPEGPARSQPPKLLSPKALYEKPRD